MIKYLSDEKIAEYVKDTLENPENMIKMLKKYGEVAAYHINHGQLHLDFDDRENSGWNQDIIGLFPTEKPAAMTSWKGIIYFHCLDDEVEDCNCMGTKAIMEMIVKYCGDGMKIREIINSKK